MELSTEFKELNSKVREEIDDLYGKINKYMAIVKKTTRDMVPKAIKLYIIDELKRFIDDDLQILVQFPTEKLVSNTVYVHKLTVFLFQKFHMK